MLSALAGGDALEIIVALKDLSEAGFRKVESNLKHLEAAANTTNLGGVSKAAKTAEGDLAKLEGKRGGGGIAGVAGGLMSLGGGPVLVAVGALTALAGAGIALTDTYDKIEQQEKALRIAAHDHGIALDALDQHVQRSIAMGEAYAFGANDVREAVAKLTEAGMSLADQQAALPGIMDLARAKNLSVAEAARMYELAVMGNTRALKDLGIALPKITTAEAAHEKAQKAVTKASDELHKAQDHLATVEASLAGKHHLTAAQALRLKQAHEHVHEASTKLNAAQKTLSKTQDDAAMKGARLKMINDDITTAVGDQRTAISPLQLAQTQLGNQWDKLAQQVGPGLEDMFTRLVRGVTVVVGWIGDLIHVIEHLIDLFLKGAGAAGDFLKSINPLNHMPDLSGLTNWIPHFASGGVVDRPTLALIGEGREKEYVIPESKMMTALPGGGRSVHVLHISIDGTALAYALERPLAKILSLNSTSVGMGSI